MEDKMKNYIITKNNKNKMKNANLISFVFIFLISISFVSALYDLGTYKQGETVRIRQTCASCSYVNISVSYPNSTFAITNDGMTSLGAGVWYYDFSSTNISGRYDVTGMGDLNGIDTSYVTYFDITRSGDPTPTGMPTLQGVLALLIFGVAWFMMYLSEKFNEVGPKIFFMLLGFIFIAGSVLTIFQILVSYNVSESLSATLTSLLFVIMMVLVIVFIFVMIRQTITVLDMLKIKKGLKMGGSPSMKGYTQNNPGFR